MEGQVQEIDVQVPEHMGPGQQWPEQSQRWHQTAVL